MAHSTTPRARRGRPEWLGGSARRLGFDGGRRRVKAKELLRRGDVAFDDQLATCYRVRQREPAVGDSREHSRISGNDGVQVGRLARLDREPLARDLRNVRLVVGMQRDGELNAIAERRVEVRSQ